MLTLDILKKRANEMRRNPTPQEARMKECLRIIKFNDIRSQVVIAPYIVDFLIMDKKLVVEIDGYFHDENRNQQNYDIRRDNHISSFGLRVWRLKNAEVENDMIQIMGKIIQLRPNISKGIYGKIKRNNSLYDPKFREEVFRRAFVYHLHMNIRKIIDWKYFGGQRPNFNTH
jgi:very-short-patch-repair endonuclease